jgi:drug/metabolite transporter (DMT)-like permease
VHGVDRGRGPGAVTDHWLLIALVLTWAISWPVIKVGVASVPPLWFAALRYAIAAPCLFAVVALRGELAWPPRSDLSLVALSSLLQMGAYSALTGMALTVLPPGRASVLAFSTPLWVVPLAAWRLRERLTRSGRTGVVLGLAGVLSIAAPSLDGDGHHLSAYAMLIGAAAAWAITIVAVRAHRFAATALALAPWQMLIAAGALLPMALLSEGAPPAIDVRGAASLAYVGPVATAFAYWAVVEAGRRYRASTMSIALLATPSLGIVISAGVLGEAVGMSLIAGVLLTGAGIGMVSLRPAPTRAKVPH